MRNILKYITIAMMTITTNTLSGQEPNTTYNANNLNPNLDKYMGVWKWESGNKSFTILLKKQNVVLPPASRNVRADILYGFHQYVDSGLIVENSLNNANSTYNDLDFTVSGGMGREGLGNTLEGSLYHISKNEKVVEFIIEYIDSNHIKLVSLKNPPGLKLVKSGQPDYDWSISLPQNIILTKQ